MHSRSHYSRFYVTGTTRIYNRLRTVTSAAFPVYLSRKLSQLHKENTSPQGVIIQKTCQRSILNTHAVKRLNTRNASTPITAPPESSSVLASVLVPHPRTDLTSKRSVNRKNMSMSDVSDMLIQLRKANVANAPKNQQAVASKNRQTSPSPAESYESSIAAIATKCVATVTESKNLRSDEMVAIPIEQERPTIAPKSIGEGATAAENASFHQPTEYTSVNKSTDAGKSLMDNIKALPTLRSIPTPVVVAPNSSQIDVKPLIHPSTGLVIPTRPSPDISIGSSVIKEVAKIVNAPVPSLISLSTAIDNTKLIPGQNNIATAGVISSNVDVLPHAAAIAAAFLRDGYNNFQQQLRTQELLKVKEHSDNDSVNASDINTAANTYSSKLLENFLRQRRFKSESALDNTADVDATDGDDEDNGFDDIHLVENSKANYNCSASNIFNPNGASSSSPRMIASNTDYMSDDSQKFLFAAQAQALRNLEYSLSDASHNSFGMLANDTNSPSNANEGPEAIYECRHCSKKYRWKSTLRRHENVECGGKEPSHQCPYCPYKSKQRGNLGVHVRKHHSDMPQLASKRRSKYSNKIDCSNNSANASDDSSSKLVIDCSK